MDHLDQLARRDSVQRVERAVHVLALIDFQAPRQRRLASEQLLVEIVAQPANALRQNDSRRDRIAERRQRNASLATAYPRTDATERHRAPDAKAAVPDAQRARQSRSVVTEIGPPVGDDVIKPATDQTERHRQQCDVIDDATLAPTGLPPPVTEHERHHDADDDEQRVRPDRDNAQMPDALRRARDVGQNSRCHTVILCRTPSASSTVKDRTAGIPSFNADTSADPTMTPSA